MPPRTDFGRWGNHVDCFDIYELWRDEKLALLESVGEDAVRQMFREAADNGDRNARALVEAGVETKADFAAFLWGTVSISYYQAYEHVASQWDRYLGIESVNSFDEVRIKGVNGLTGIGYVGDYGRYSQMRRTFRPEAAIVVDTYGGEYHMTRKLLRSNNAQMLVDRNPADLGAAMADFISRLVVGLVIANPNAPDGNPMYSNTRGNQQAADVSENTLVDAAVFLRNQKDDDGRPIRANIRAAVMQNDRQAFLIRRAIRSQQTGVQIQNPAATQFPMGTDNALAYPDSSILPEDGVIIDPYWPDANDVYFFADPNVLPAFVAAFLDGQRQPMIGMLDATVMHLANSAGNGHDPYSFQGDAISYKTRHDVGVSAVDARGTYRLTPA